MTALHRLGPLLLALALCGPMAATSQALPCRAVVDAAGDVRLPNGGAPPAYPTSLDVLSADVATDRTLLTSVIRVERLLTVEPGSPGGLSFWFVFTANRSRFVLNAFRTPYGDYFNLYLLGGGPGADTGAGSASTGWTRIIAPADGYFDEDRSEVHFTVALEKFAPYQRITPGMALKDLHAESFFQVSAVVGRMNHTADVARSTAIYRAGDPSCVPVGS